ncbi:DUF2625 domain-containing protein [Kibdelosporangium philippinense]|uniref:DUF2625 domain-containing protein n=1 Tax=Kibdelosporangium philippinense TaxID=211113 RepID=A0ABS8ZE91_9PSEU|nr:DUF2625 family protein [Kibdelosporangium philippinense]MCE7004833.1 DUF2625 domain-containing protein [Kibdelosporangium philippinense]
MTTSAWDEITETTAAAPYPVTVLPEHPQAEECLNRLGITTNSWLGAVVRYSGGMLIDHGWLRVIGSGAEHLPGILTDINPASGVLHVANDVLGGQFAWIATEKGPTIHYFAPDTLEWEDLEQGYTDWLYAVLSGSLTKFYESLRWPGWAEEVAETRPDQGIHTWPPPSTEEGKDLATVSRKVVPLAELVSFHHG